MKQLKSKICRKFISILLALSLVIGINAGMPIKIVNAATEIETAWFPVNQLHLTQLAFESYSHGKSWHIDCIGGPYAFAPFTGKFVNKTTASGAALFQSINKVKFANGVEDYMTVIFMHGTPLHPIDKIVPQGADIYKMGGITNSGQNTGAIHYDIGVKQGKEINFPKQGDGLDTFGTMFPYDAFVVNTSKTTKVINEGVIEPPNHMTRNFAPSNYKGLWRTNKAGSGTTTGGSSTKVSVTYQTYDTIKKAWLPNVTNDSDYAGILGNPISAVYANLSSGNITYRVHVKGGGWLPEVKNRSDYAGVYSKPIDGLMMKTDTGKTIHYQVHTKGGKWLDYVTGYSTSNSNNGYAGIFGKEIDGIRIYVD